jgi:hypothetical protein
MPKLKLKFKLPKEEAEANFALKGGITLLLFII